MFDLKKYKITKDFNGYKAGQLVAFNGKDAERFADKIKLAEATKEVKEEPAKDTEAAKEVKTIKKGKK